jgi:uncharacterized protein YbaR (Trm112 family)
MKPDLRSLIVCPRCKATLIETDHTLTCTDAACRSCYPVIDDIPILINDDIGTFKASAYKADIRGSSTWYGRFRRKIRAWSPKISGNIVARRNFAHFRDLLLNGCKRPAVLIIGGAEAGAGTNELFRETQLNLIETDVVIGPRTELICDGCFLPFASESMDGVIIQAVLEYLLDPKECVDEIYRVLKPGGIVYSEMPFMQGVHGGKHDFTRLTLLGHRRLYRDFSEIQSGACAGPATALAWSIQHLFLSFTSSQGIRDLIRFGAALSLFWLKYIDRLLIKTPGALDAATGTYLMAGKSLQRLSDQELLLQYRGAVRSGGII